MYELENLLKLIKIVEKIESKRNYCVNLNNELPHLS